jgi:aspartyl-tRNA(Asn)/glutamyl-tRNA(Gln) amidotransferase subunit B
LATDGFVTFVSNNSNDGAITNIQQQQQDGTSVDVTAKKKQRRRGVSNIVVDSINNDSGNTVDDHSKQSSNEPTANTLNTITLRIERIQLEQDTGKTTTIITRSNNAEEETADGSMHCSATTSQTHSLIDYNRAGCALIEIVSYPDLRSASDAAAAVERICTLLKHVGSCDGRMEEGSLRCDLNVSIAPIVEENSTSDNDLSLQTLQTSELIGKEEELRLRLPPNTGHRVEVKNLNSLRQIVAAAEYEALRQSDLALLLTPTGRETRTFHVKPTSTLHPLGGETCCIRTKGDAVDYRFLPEPDLPPLILDEETLGIEEGLSSSSSSVTCPIQDYIDRYMPESIESTKLRLVNDYSLTEDVANIITSDPPAIVLFEEAVTFARSELRSMNENMDDDDKVLQSLPTMVANCLCNDLYALIKKSAAIKCSSSSNAAAARGEGANDDCNVDNGANVTTSTLDHPISVEYTSMDGHRLGALVAMVANGMLTSSMAKKVLAVMYEDDGQAGREGNEESKTSSSLHGGYSHPNDIANKYGWRIISDWDTLVQLCDGVVNDPQHLAQLEQYKMGDERKRWKIDKFYVGKIMAASNGNAHPERMKEALAFVLNKLK